MKKRLLLIALLSLVSGILYVPFINAGSEEPSTIVWIIFPLATTALMLLFGWLGIILAEKGGFKMPILKKFENGEKILKSDYKILLIPCILGFAFAIITYLTSFFVDVPKNPGNIFVRILTTPWAGLVTETVSHLFVMSAIYLLIKNRWISIILSSLLFVVLFHLNGMDYEVSVAVILVSANFLASVLTGWIYSKYGYESAVLAHASMHLVMLTLN